MTAGCDSRRFPFHGTDQEYIVYLENRLSSCLNKTKTSKKTARPARRSASKRTHTESTTLHKSGATFRIQTPETRAQTETPTLCIWQDITADFLHQVPTCEEEWQKKRINVQLSTAVQKIHVFRLLTLNPSELSVPNPFIAPKTSSKVVIAYRNLESMLRNQVNHSTQLHKYSLLLFFCVCAVARHDGMSVEEVNDFIKTCLPHREQGAEYSTRLRRAAKWTACVIEQLEDRIPASHLFFLTGPPLETYRKWATYTQTASYLVHEIEKRIGSLNKTEDTHVSFSPAFLITCTGYWSLEQVNKALGTELSQEEYDRRVRVLQETEAQIIRRANETSTGLNTLAMASVHQDGLRVAGAGQAALGVSEAFTRTGNPEAMLGDPETSAGHTEEDSNNTHSSDPCTEAETGMDVFMGEEEFFCFQDNL